MRDYRKGDLVTAALVRIPAYKEFGGVAGYTAVSFAKGDVFVVERSRSKPEFGGRMFTHMTRVLCPQDGRSYWIDEGYLQKL